MTLLCAVRNYLYYIGGGGVFQVRKRKRLEQSRGLHKKLPARKIYKRKNRMPTE